MEARIFIVEDHPIFQEGLANIISEEEGLQVCGTADDVAEALAGIERTTPHLVIIDLELKASSGFDLVKDVTARWPHLRTLVLSMYDEMHYAGRVLRAGAAGYVMKDQGPEVVLQAIHAVLQGRQYVSEAVRQRLGEHGPYTSPVDALTDRELQIFQCLGKGKSVFQTALLLRRSVKTIHNHIGNIQTKLQIESRQELYQRAREWVLRADRASDM